MLVSDFDFRYISDVRSAYACALLVSNTETMREIKRLARSKMLLHSRPHSNLTRIREQVLNDCSLLASLLNVKEVLARYPTVGNGLVPAL